MSHIVAVANQKGGVAKTTTVASIGAALSESGVRVLLVDLDPQACLTFSLGIDPDDIPLSVHDVLLGRVGIRLPIVSTEDGPDLLPATIDLAGAEVMLNTRAGRELVLKQELLQVSDSYDVILLDCSPSLGVLTLNALAAADEVIVPLQCETLSHRGVGQLLDTIGEVRRVLNPALDLHGVLPTMFDSRTTHANAVLGDVSERYNVAVLMPPIARSIRFAEAPAVGRSVLSTAKGTPGAQAYREHAAALAIRAGIRPRLAVGE